MPRARQMPRTTALLVMRRLIWLVAVVYVAAMAPIASAAGDMWWLALLVLVGLAVLLGWLLGRVVRLIDSRVPSAAAKDRLAVPMQDRVLPYGVVSDGSGGVLLPAKLSVVILVAMCAAGVLALGIAMTTVDGGDVRIAGSIIIVLGVALAVLATGVARARVRLTADGIVSGSFVRRSYRWIDVPELKIDRAIIVLKSASEPRPRVWIRAGMLQASPDACVRMIRQQRNW